MKTLQTYLECGEGCATPANTMGMGNPGEIGPDTLSEPLHTAKSEIEKDKKKHKRKIKSLSESIFDKDIISKDICIGDIYELDEWTIPARGHEYEFTDDVIKWGIKPTCGLPWGLSLGSKHWQKHLKPLDSFPKVTNVHCCGSYFLKYVTDIILCCKSIEQISIETKKYILECKNNPNHYKNDYDREFVKKHVFKNVEVQTLDTRDQPLRMVVIKFIMEDGKDCVICMTLKKRDL